jgi:hypothetical protein
LQLLPVFGKELEGVLLMIVFGAREAPERNDFCKDRPVGLRGYLCFACLGQSPLFFIMIEYDGSVLAGPGPAGRIVAFPEEVQELAIGGFRRVVINLYGLSMIAEIVIGRCGLCASCIADPCSDDTGMAPEPGVRPPESAHGKGCRFYPRGNSEIDRRPRRL